MQLWQSESPEMTQQLAEDLARRLPRGTVLSLKGDLGAGKTAFAQGFARALGVQRAVKSPTYTIVKEYPLPDSGHFVHIDAYRLEEGGGDSIDLPRYLTADNYILIEWAEFIAEDLPASYIELSFFHQGPTQRTIHGQIIGENQALEDVLGYEDFQEEAHHEEKI